MLSTDKNSKQLLRTVEIFERSLCVDNVTFQIAQKILCRRNFKNFLPFAQITWQRKVPVFPVSDVLQ